MTMLFPTPSNEAERLQAFHRLKILDGGLPAGMDRICSVAQDLFQVPVVLMVFLDESLAWIKKGPQPGLSEALGTSPSVTTPSCTTKCSW